MQNINNTLSGYVSVMMQYIKSTKPFNRKKIVAS